MAMTRMFVVKRKPLITSPYLNKPTIEFKPLDLGSSRVKWGWSRIEDRVAWVKGKTVEQVGD